MFCGSPPSTFWRNLSTLSPKALLCDSALATLSM
jgi:hypothetical protein